LVPTQGRALLVALYDAAVAGAAPGPLTTAALRSERPSARTHLFALGKASRAMAMSAVEWIERNEGEVAGGMIVSSEDAISPHLALELSVGDHPLPGPRSFAAAARLEHAAARVRAGDEALVLLSGGATSLLAAPAGAFSGADVTRLFDLLHRSGLDIHGMNVVRKRFTRWGAGRLAVALAAAHTRVLIMSDVPGDDPADVASGPCTPDVSCAEDVTAILRDTGLLADLPPDLRDHLDAVIRGQLPETPKPGETAFVRVRTDVIGSNALAVDASVARARGMGLSAERGDMALAGEAAAAGDEVARVLLDRAAHGWRGCLVWGGETTVRRAADAAHERQPGLGGRCQELALAAARRLAGSSEHARRVALLAAGTDGRDGPTDAAGAFADARVWDAIRRSVRDPEQSLARHRSYDALDAAGALLRVPPTGTNVMDVVIGVVE
jgi:glycerate 2-kinase